MIRDRKKAACTGGLLLAGCRHRLAGFSGRTGWDDADVLVSSKGSAAKDKNGYMKCRQHQVTFWERLALP